MTSPRAPRGDEGFMMAALLVAMAVMMIAMTAALPAWQTAARREKEAELIFRGKQYSRAIGGFQRKYGNALPPTVDVLITERFLRKKFKDPITNDDFVFVGPGQTLPTTSTGPGGVNNAPSTRPGGTGGSSTLQTPAGAQSSLSSLSSNLQLGRGTSLGTSTQTTQAGRSSSTSSSNSSSTTTGIQAVYSKSKDKSLRVYNGYDHYNEWIFTATAATTTVTSPTGGQAGAGTRGGAAGTRGGAPTGGRGGQPAGGAGRGGGPGGGNPFGGGANPFGGTAGPARGR